MPKGKEWVSWDKDAPEEAIAEAQRRHSIDNIPRHAYADGKVMKWDWELSAESLRDNINDETLEDHIAKLIEQAEAYEQTQ